MEKYDVIFGMGYACSCTQALREAGLQHASFPFDWVGGRGIRFKAQLMADDFPKWFEPGTLTRMPDQKFSFHAFYRDIYDFTPIHDFSANVPLEEELPKVHAKYRRRIDRLARLLDGAKRVLVVYIETLTSAKSDPADIPEVRSTLARRWPNVKFEFLLLRFGEGVPFAERAEETGDGWRLVTYDYKDRKEEEWRADWHQIGHWLKTQYAVVDYRTEAEREAWRQSRRHADWARYHATSWTDYLMTKMRYKIYKHLRTVLSRKGVI